MILNRITVAPPDSQNHFKTFQIVSKSVWLTALRHRVERALHILRGKGSGYHCLWISKNDGGATPADSFELPDDLYFDLYEDYHQHSLYQAGSVRIDAARFTHNRQAHSAGAGLRSLSAAIYVGLVRSADARQPFAVLAR